MYVAALFAYDAKGGSLRRCCVWDRRAQIQFHFAACKSLVPAYETIKLILGIFRIFVLHTGLSLEPFRQIFFQSGHSDPLLLPGIPISNCDGLVFERFMINRNAERRADLVLPGVKFAERRPLSEQGRVRVSVLHGSPLSRSSARCTHPSSQPAAFDLRRSPARPHKDKTAVS